MAQRTRIFPEPIRRDYDWAFANYGKLVKRYPDQWVAFSDHRILSAGSNLMQVMKKAHEQIDQPEIPHLFVERGIHIWTPFRDDWPLHP